MKYQVFLFQWLESFTKGRLSSAAMASGRTFSPEYRAVSIWQIWESAFGVADTAGWMADAHRQKHLASSPNGESPLRSTLPMPFFMQRG